MSTNRYFGDDIATFSVVLQDGTSDGTPVVAAGVKDVTITGSGEHTNLFTAQSVKRQEVKRSEVTFDVEFTIVEFNNELAAYWLSGGDETVDPSTSPVSLADTTDVAKFDATVEQDSTDGNATLKADISGMDIPEIPILELAEGEFNEHSYSGTADDVTVETV